MAQVALWRRRVPLTPKARLYTRAGVTVAACLISLLLPLLLSGYGMSVAVSG